MVRLELPVVLSPLFGVIPVTETGMKVTIVGPAGAFKVLEPHFNEIRAVF
jgi:hypothetical protein